MMMRINILSFILFVILAICGVLSYIFWGSLVTLNFVFAYVSFVIIVGMAFIMQRRKIMRLISQASQEELESLKNLYQSKEEKEEEFWGENEDKDDEKFVKECISKKKKFWKSCKKESGKVGFKMFFMPLRLLTYAVFIVLFLFFLKKELFDFVGFFGGLIVGNFALVMALFLAKVK